MFSKIINSLTLVASLVTASSVLVHDTRVDRAVVAVNALPLPATYEETSANKLLSPGDPHTHVERTSIQKNFASVPRIQPRNDEKKHMLQKRVAKGHHAFDNYNLPIV
jgi:hypothetical protein